MRKLAPLTLLCLLTLAGAAGAADIKVGDANISCNIPEGYVQAQGEAYAEFLSLLNTVMPQNAIKLHAAYVPKDIDQIYRKGESDTLDRYLLLTHLTGLEDKTLTAESFQQLKDSMLKSQGEILEGAELREKVNQHLADKGVGNIQVGGVKNLGFFAATDTRISMLGLQTINVDGAAPLEQAVVMTQLLAGRKLITIYQYLTVKSPDEIAPFAEDSTRVVNSMGFK